MSTNGGSTWSNTTATGATTKSISGFELTEARVGNRYRCKITDGNGYVLYSEPAQICKNVATVITQPTNFTGITGSRVEFSIEAVGPGLTYQWQVSGNGTTWSDSTAGGNTTASMWVNQTAGNVGNQYRCKVTDSAGNVVYSTPGTIRHASETWYYTYNADGIRTKATNGIDTYEYVYDGGTLSRLIVNGGTPVYFIYDGNGNPLCFSYGGSKYYYATNLQGDITAIVSHEGNTLVRYTYDAWGKPLTITGSRASDLGILNPLRYRGYVYDDVSQLYYLQSRYYDPEIGRFINADAPVSTGQGIIGFNMFAYCLNNPANASDPTGAMMVYVDMERVSPGGPSSADGLSSTYSGGSSGSLWDDVVDFFTNTDEQVVLSAKYVAFYKGVPVVKLPIGMNAFSCGFIFLGDDVDQRADSVETVQHEYGHSVHFRLVGPLSYAVTVFAPSVIGFHFGNDNYKANYHSYVYEYTADQLGNADYGPYSEATEDWWWVYFLLTLAMP